MFNKAAAKAFVASSIGALSMLAAHADSTTDPANLAGAVTTTAGVATTQLATIAPALLGGMVVFALFGFVWRKVKSIPH